MFVVQIFTGDEMKCFLNSQRLFFLPSKNQSAFHLFDSDGRRCCHRCHQQHCFTQKVVVQVSNFLTWP